MSPGSATLSPLQTTSRLASIANLFLLFTSMRSLIPGYFSPLFILKENDGITGDEKEIANLLNDYFIHIADSMPEIRVEDYCEDYANDPSI